MTDPATLADVLAELRSINAKLAQSADSRSSVEVRTSTRGVDAICKAYAGSSILEAEQEAVQSYFRVMNTIQERLMGGANDPA